ncbi:MAG: right-handed parallel beta-helix repeat-containing protein [Planctomycetes bacterium]|nr:right-handed parallel beta-helix repeat-containing protein [Planctomycetota bacterium]
MITAGNADAPFPHNRGAGVNNVLSSPSIINCILYRNSAQFGGGMLNGSLSSPIVTRCLFLENVASERGGGVSNHFSGNPLLIECTMRGNRAQRGGALSNFFQTNAVMINCVFVGNSAEANGGAVHSSQTDPTFINCMFSDNHAKGNGGAVYSLAGSNTSMINCTFKGNGALAGGAIYTTDEFSGNLHSTAEVSNCIAHGNVPDQIASVSGATTTVDFSNVEGGFIGDGNIDADPLFVDPEGDEANLRLLAGSPCIDAADNTAVPEGIVADLDGNPRFVDDPDTDDTGFGKPPIVDMGAYEFQLQDPCECVNGRVTLCHIPPGNLANARTITVGCAAGDRHLAHGDVCGPCE